MTDHRHVKIGCPDARVNGAGARVDNDGISGQLNRSYYRLNRNAWKAHRRPLENGEAHHA